MTNSDEHLRFLERQARQLGTLEVRVSLLVERLRQGIITENGIRLAAVQGDPAAQEILPNYYGWPDEYEGIDGLTPKQLYSLALLGFAADYDSRHPAVKAWKQGKKYNKADIDRDIRRAFNNSDRTMSPADFVVIWAQFYGDSDWTNSSLDSIITAAVLGDLSL